MEKTKWIWLNGNFVEWDNAQVHFLTHSLHYSGAVFEGIRCYKTAKGPAVFRLKDHVQRLFESAKIIGMPVTFTEDDVLHACIETVQKNNLEECYIRPLCFYGTGEMGIDTTGRKADVAIAVWKWGAYLGNGRSNGVKVATSSWRKVSPDAMPVHAKVSGNYTQAIIAKKEAKKQGFDEAILLDPCGFIAEGPGENVFIVKNEKLLTPPTTYALKGITRATILALSEQLQIPTEVTPLTRDDCYAADEMFFTGTAAEVTPITEYDHRSIGNGKCGKITTALQALFFRVVRGESPSGWLTHV